MWSFIRLLLLAIIIQNGISSTETAITTNDITDISKPLGKFGSVLSKELVELNVKLVNKTKGISDSFKGQIKELKASVSQRFSNTSRNWRDEIVKLESKVRNYIITSSHSIIGKIDTLEEDTEKSQKTLETKLTVEISKATSKMSGDVRNRTKIYLKKFADLNTKIKSVEMVIHNVTATKKDSNDSHKEIADFEKKMTEKYNTLKKTVNVRLGGINSTLDRIITDKLTDVRIDVDASIVHRTEEMKKTIETDMKTKYGALKKELNDNIASVAKAIVKDMLVIKKEVAELKKSMEERDWPSGAYCIYKVGHWCPPKFYSHYYKGVYYCCHGKPCDGKDCA